MKKHLKRFVREKVLRVKPMGPLFRQLLQDHTLTLYDVGASGGVQPQWQDLVGAADFHLFEPDPRSRSELGDYARQTGFPSSFQIHDLAFSDFEGQGDLCLTNVRTGSTLMQIDEGSDGFQHLSKSYFYPAEQMQIQVTTVDQFQRSKALSMDGIKIDTQGAEFKVLNGAAAALDQALCIDFEVGVIRLYKDQESFSTIFDFLTKKGFTLHDVRVSRSFLCRDGNPEFYQDYFQGSRDYQSLSARAWEFDCAFFQRPENLVQRKDPVAIHKMLALLCAYRFYAEATHLVDQAKATGLFPDSLAIEMRQVIKEIHAINCRRNRLAFFKQRLRELTNLKRTRYWSRFLWIDYPSS